MAAENFWGSIAAQLGGSKVAVASIITNPNTDPHSYEPTAADARTFATGQMVIVDGIGYDPWATQLLAANPVSGRVELNVGELVHVAVGGNPHQWYSPASVHAVIDQITADYQRLDPADSAYFASQRTRLSHPGPGPLRPAHRRHQGQVRRHPGGRLGEHLRASWPRRSACELLTPPSFLGAISEGHRAHGRRQADDRPPDRGSSDQGLRLQLAKRDPRRAGPGAGGHARRASR